MAKNKINKKLPVISECKHSGALLDDILPYAFDYIRRKKMGQPLFSRFKKIMGKGEKYPDNWEDSVLGMLFTGILFGSINNTSAFIRAIKDELADNALSLVRQWKSIPWFYCAYTVVNEFGKDLLEISPVGSSPSFWPPDEPWDTLFLYSPSTAMNYRKGKKLFISLLWKGKEAFQTYGLIIPFSAINSNDIFFFSDVLSRLDVPPAKAPLKGINDNVSNISSLMGRDPLSYLQLFKWSEAPAVNTKKEPMLVYASVICVSEDVKITDENQWRAAIEKSGDEIESMIFEKDAAALFLGSGSPMYDPAVYVSFPDRRIFLSAMTSEGYKRGKDAVSAICVFPDLPHLSASINITTAAHDILEYDDKFLQLQKHFDGKKGVDSRQADSGIDENVPEIEELNAIMNRIVENHNDGIKESDSEIALSLGVKPGLVSSIRKKIDSMFDNTGLSGKSSAGDAEAADRAGLSPKAFHNLCRSGIPDIKGTFKMHSEEKFLSVILEEGFNFKKLFSDVPVMRFSLWFLDKAIKSGSIPATRSGYVGTKIIEQALENRIIKSPFDLSVEYGFDTESNRQKLDEKFKPKKEIDWPDFLYMRELLEDLSLIKLSNQKFIAAEKAKDLLQVPASLYYYLLEGMFTCFEWAYSDYFTLFSFIQDYSGFLFYCIKTLSKSSRDGWVSSRDLTSQFMAAVPDIKNQLLGEKTVYDGDGLSFIANIVLESLFLNNFAGIFGLIEFRDKKPGDAFFRPSALFNLVFGE
ncbi:MAG: hypothetical protein RBT69_11760 [Spirochaetia bacterium]|jgi:hypothetical protein|nr:hypothetical protein [Spirochaetia bacterium]